MVERLFSYSHPGHRPPELVPLPDRGAFDPTAMSDADLGRALDGLEANPRWLDAVRLGVLGDSEQRGLHERHGAASVANDLDNLTDQVGLGELDTGTAVSATAVRRLACDADIISAVFGGESELLDLGRKARLVSPAQRAALALRDRGCTFPNCDRPAGWCDAHHIDHWIDGGPTDLDNLTLLCSRHHHLLHEGGWRVRSERSGELVFTNRAGVILADTTRRPGHPDPWVGATPGHPPERRTPAQWAPTEDEEDDAA